MKSKASNRRIIDIRATEEGVVTHTIKPALWGFDPEMDYDIRASIDLERDRLRMV